MLQVVLLILIAVAVVAGGVWLSANPGSMNVEWLGWQVETNIIVALIAVVVLFVGLYVAFWILGALAGLVGLRVAGSPGNLRSALRGLSEGYAAIRAGKGGEARVEAKRAAWGRKDRARSPGALMVADGTAMSGDIAGARALYKELLDVPECEAGALRGLLELAIMDGDDDGIREYSERALFKVDKPVWAARAAVDLALRTNTIDKAEHALQVLEAATPAEAAEIRRLRADAFLAQARSAEAAGKASDAVTLCRKALSIDPEAPRVVDALARILGTHGKAGKAEQLVKETWQRAPDPLLARTWRDLSGSSDPTAIANHMQALAALKPEHPESRLAAAEAAADAKMWSQARGQLEPLTAEAEPGLRTCLLMARIEEGDGADATKVMDWLRRAAAAAGGLGEMRSARAAADRPAAA